MISFDTFTGDTTATEPLDTTTSAKSTRKGGRGRRPSRRHLSESQHQPEPENVDEDAAGGGSGGGEGGEANDEGEEEAAEVEGGAKTFKCYPDAGLTDYSDDESIPPSAATAPTSTTSGVGGPRRGDSRVQHWFQLLSLKNHTDNAKQALVQRLLGVSDVKELILSKATHDQIASAANDAITDEILATVDLEDKRRQSITAASDLFGENDDSSASALILMGVGGAGGQFSTYRVLELVDVLDSTTGGMVKRILTNVRRRTPIAQRTGPRRQEKSEFCGFCVAYRGHVTAQHRCRVCGALGEHRSQYCGKKNQPSPSSGQESKPAPSSGRSTPSTARFRRRGSQSPASTASRLTPDHADKSFCTFCSTWGFHSTENHRCRICGVVGEHRSRNCTKKHAREGYRWRGSPAEPPAERKMCDLCGTLRGHSTAEHRCRICLKLGEHRSKNCPMHSPGSTTFTSPEPPALAAGERTTPSDASAGANVCCFCTFCGKDVAHRSEEHICRVCRATGVHRSGDCPSKKETTHSVLSYSVETASKVRDRVLESIPLVLPSSATTLVLDSIDKVGDVDLILRRTLQRIGVWGGGSQTPITTPYSAPIAKSRQPIDLSVAAPPALLGVEGTGAYVLSYAEGRSVVPERILKYMRLLMHHEISTNAFSVVVRFDPRSSHWELQKPGMVTPRSLPSSPTMGEQLKKRMAKYTLQTLLGAREKLVKLIVAQKTARMNQGDN